VRCQLLVQERVVCGQQLQHAAVFDELALDEQFGFLAEGLPQVLVEFRVVGSGVARELAQAQPLAREVS
jgi:hypothetical protein